MFKELGRRLDEQCGVKVYNKELENIKKKKAK